MCRPEPSESQPRWRIAVEKSRRALVVWGLLLLFVVYTVVQNIGSGVVTGVGGLAAMVECEGFTWIESRECSPWGADPPGVRHPVRPVDEQVTRLVIKRSLFELVDNCTAEFDFDDATTAAQEIECR